MMEYFEEQKDYIISSKTNLNDIETPQLIILTVFNKNIQIISEMFPTKKVLQQIAFISDPEIIVATPFSFIKNIKSYTLKSKHILLYEPDLIEDLDYLQAINFLRTMGFYFIAYASNASFFNFLENPVIISSSVQYLIKCVENEDFYVIFYIFKMCLLDGSIAIVTDDQNKFTKVKIFMEAIHQKCDIYLHKDSTYVLDINNEKVYLENQFYNNIIMVGSNIINFNSDRIIFLSSKNLNIKEEIFDFDRVSKYKYRIDDLLRGITPNVLKGRKMIDLTRFSSFKKDI